jgi:outer membrane protein assembly factor BamB
VGKLTTIVVAATLLLAGCWTQIGFGPEHAGFNRLETTISTTNVGQLAHAWSADLGDVTNVPVVVGSTVYASSYPGAITALDASSGAQRWQTLLGRQGQPADFADAPTFDGENLRVPVSFSQFLTGGTFTVDPATGSADDGHLAERNLEGVVASDLHDATAWAQSIVSEASLNLLHYPGCCHDGAIDAGLTTQYPFTVPALVGRRALLGVGPLVRAWPFDSCVEFPVTESITFCAPQWSTDVGSRASFPVGIGHGLVAVGTAKGEVVVLDVATGAERWRSTKVTGPLTAPASDGTHLFVGTGGGRVDVYDIDGCGAPTCTRRWSNVLFAAAAGQPAIANGLVYATTTDGHVRAFDATGCGTPPCTALWSRRPSTTTLTGPVVANGGVYVVTTGGSLVAYRLPD